MGDTRRGFIKLFPKLAALIGLAPIVAKPLATKPDLHPSYVPMSDKEGWEMFGDVTAQAFGLKRRDPSKDHGMVRRFADGVRVDTVFDGEAGKFRHKVTLIEKEESGERYL